MDLEEQQRWGEEIAARKEILAREATDLQFEREPGLRERFGERGVAKSYDDALHTLDFLSESVSLGSTATFAGYVSWLDGVLISAHVPPMVLPAHLNILKEVMANRLSPAAVEQATKTIDEALARLAEKRAAS
jgi:MerR family transcriptional regulator, light-induced transcriptional regulator